MFVFLAKYGLTYFFLRQQWPPGENGVRRGEGGRRHVGGCWGDRGDPGGTQLCLCLKVRAQLASYVSKREPLGCMWVLDPRGQEDDPSITQDGEGAGQEAWTGGVRRPVGELSGLWGNPVLRSVQAHVQECRISDVCGWLGQGQ